MPAIALTRGEQVESIHPFSAVAVDAEGRVVRWMGPEVSACWRSAAKPFQLRCSLEALAQAGVATDDLSAEQIAIGAASHAGQIEHIRLVRGMLARFGVPESALACAPHPPSFDGAYRALIRGGGEVTDIHNNCSGKHTYMLAASAAQGWTGDYRDPEHPLQRRIRDAVVGLCGHAPAAGVDGCGVPTFGMPIDGFARAWATLGRAALGDGDPVLGRIGRAMEAWPHLISGTGKLDEDMAGGRRERMITKIGAQALYCIALPERGLGVAVKMHTGVELPLGEAVAVALDAFAPGAWARPSDWTWDVIPNVAGRVVGKRALTDYIP
ncbi:MAG: asparaginase [Alphaproteobacteria bacterium]|nr:asparaginase [Alphaproteobacteria bacterium]